MLESIWRILPHVSINLTSHNCNLLKSKFPLDLLFRNCKCFILHKFNTQDFSAYSRYTCRQFNENALNRISQVEIVISTSTFIPLLNSKLSKKALEWSLRLFTIHTILLKPFNSWKMCTILCWSSSKKSKSFLSPDQLLPTRGEDWLDILENQEQWNKNWEKKLVRGKRRYH